MKDLDKLMAALSALKGATPEKRARVAAAAKEAVKSVEDRRAESERSRKVMLAIEAAERAERDRMVPVPMPEHGNVKARSWEAQHSQARSAEHRMNRGEMAWAEIVRECQKKAPSDHDRLVLQDATLERKLDNIETRQAKRGRMPRP